MFYFATYCDSCDSQESQIGPKYGCFQEIKGGHFHAWKKWGIGESHSWEILSSGGKFA